jgi:tetratricopeptide (TPR) repeat protein
MRILSGVSIFLVLAVCVSAQRSANNPASGVFQNAAMTSAPETSPRDQALTRAALDMIHKEYSDAADIYKSLLRDTPNDANLWNQLGIAYHQQGMVGDALRCYERATKLNKKDAPAWNNIGTVYFQERRLPKAIRTYKRAIGLDSANATFYSNLGIADLNDKHVPEALDAFRQAVKLDPDVFVQNGRVGSILQDRSADDHGTFFFLVAKSFAAQGNAERCAFYLRKSADEGYEKIGSAKTDPAFSGVLKDPSIREILGLAPLAPVSPQSMGL